MPSSAPCSRANASFSADDAQAITRAPMILPSSIAARPDAAGRAEHGERFARLEIGAILQRVQRRAVGDAEAGGAVEIEAVRNFDQLVGGDRDAFARRAIARIADDAVADRELR